VTFNHRRRTLTIWIATSTLYSLMFLVSGAILLLRAPAEHWLAYSIPFAAPVLFAAVFLTRVVRSRQVPAVLKNPASVQFSTQNVPGAMVYLEPFLLPGIPFPRRPAFIIAADDAGISYFTQDKTPRPFVHIPWRDVSSVDELAGELCVTLVGDGLLLHIPGGLLPVSVRRVRGLAAQLSALQPQRQL
jgi:hypothetical protein